MKANLALMLIMGCRLAVGKRGKPMSPNDYYVSSLTGFVTHAPPTLETILVCRWEGVRLPQSFWNFSELPKSSSNFLRSSSVTSLKLLSMRILRAIHRFPEVALPRSNRTSPEVSTSIYLGSPTPSDDSHKVPLSAD